jgi:hypothetical protein
MRQGISMTPSQQLTRDDLNKIVLSNIQEFGWHAVNVIEDNDHPPWTYTIGLYESYGFPELIIFGRSRATAYHALKTVATALEENHPPDLKLPTLDLIPGIPCLYREVSTRYYQDYVGYARWFYRKRHFPLYQIIWPNNEGHYPWDPHAPRPFKEWQPLLGEFSGVRDNTRS